MSRLVRPLVTGVHLSFIRKAASEKKSCTCIVLGLAGRCSTKEQPWVSTGQRPGSQEGISWATKEECLGSQQEGCPWSHQVECLGSQQEECLGSHQEECLGSQQEEGLGSQMEECLRSQQEQCLGSQQEPCVGSQQEQFVASQHNPTFTSVRLHSSGTRNLSPWVTTGSYSARMKRTASRYLFKLLPDLQEQIFLQKKYTLKKNCLNSAW